MENVLIRNLTKDDLEAIVAIDKQVLGENRRDYWQMKLERVVEKPTLVSFAAELEGKVVGFILGDISGWEFGVPDTTGWLDTIGVDPSYQKKGLATMLIQELVRNMKAVGVKTIYTLVSWDDWDLLQFFRSTGFTRGDMINLELKI